MIITVMDTTYLTAAAVKVRPEKNIQTSMGFTCKPMTSAIIRVQCIAPEFFALFSQPPI